MAKAWNAELRDDIGAKINGAAPPGVNYDTWVGPEEMVPFMKTASTEQVALDFGTGDMGNHSTLHGGRLQVGAFGA